jgi:hypothetical protein
VADPHDILPFAAWMIVDEASRSVFYFEILIHFIWVFLVFVPTGLYILSFVVMKFDAQVEQD